MIGRRPAWVVAGIVALACVLAGCGRSGSSSRASAPPRGKSIVALGDSVPSGTNCDCTPYPELTASGLTTSTHQTVSATNDAVGGYTTSSVLNQLESRRRVIDHVRHADTVEIEIGANDVAYSNSCGNSVECYAPKVPTIEKNLDAIVARVHDLTAGHKVLVVLLDYWSVWLGGQYAAAKGEAYVAAAEEMTDRVNRVIRTTAEKTGSAYVDLRAAFKGPNYSYDETRYLSNDGDHPNAAGHQKIATAAQAVIEKTLAI